MGSRSSPAALAPATIALLLVLAACAEDDPGQGGPPASRPDAASSGPDTRVVPDTAPVDVQVPEADAPGGEVAADAIAADAASPGDGAPADGGGLRELGDDFSGDRLDPSWGQLNTAKVDLAVRDGALHLAPTQSLLWFNNSAGALVSKLVTGNFKASATVRPRKRSEPTQVPTDRIQLGGLMARNPAGGRENHVLIAVGVDANDHSVDTQTTVNGSSIYVGPSWATADAELRVCRLGSDFRLYKRVPGAASWTLATTYTRVDLPARLEVGPIVHAAADKPDFDVAFDEVRFAPAATPEECAQD
jgi:hypothetical protein